VVAHCRGLQSLDLDSWTPNSPPTAKSSFDNAHQRYRDGACRSSEGSLVGLLVIPDFKDKIRYAPYVSFRSQIPHIATNKR